MTFEQIKELIDIVCSMGLEELEIERSDFRVKIKGQNRTAVVSGVAPNAAGTGASAPTLVAVESQSTPLNAVTAGAGEHVIYSPIVGTFYAAPSPDSDPYISVGDVVEQGQVLCIVEAMKLMNEIESDTTGEVVAVHVKNAQPVEFGEPLFTVRPA